MFALAFYDKVCYNGGMSYEKNRKPDSPAVAPINSETKPQISLDDLFSSEVMAGISQQELDFAADSKKRPVKEPKAESRIIEKNADIFSQNVTARDEKIIEAVDKRAEYNSAKGATKTFPDGRFVRPEAVASFAAKTDFQGREIEYKSFEARLNAGKRHTDEILRDNLGRSRELGKEACELCASYYDGNCTWIFNAEYGHKDFGAIVSSEHVDSKKLYRLRDGVKMEMAGKEPISECFDKYHLSAKERRIKNASNPRVILAEPTPTEQDG